MSSSWFAIIPVLLLVGCQRDGIELFGYGSGDVSDRITVLSDSSDGNRRPQDLAFDRQDDSVLWVVNRTEDSVTIHRGVGTGDVDVEKIIDPYALHFMEKVSSIAWGKGDTFATCQDSLNTYNGDGAPNEFMGPTLWSADPDIFGHTNPEAVEALTEQFNSAAPVNLGSHLDMLHESPQCMGIAWEEENVYWVFDGYHERIVSYDFAVDHGPGWDDHSDGIVRRHMEADVEREDGIVSHLVMDHATKLLYVADTGNNRIMVLDTTTGRDGRDLGSQDCSFATGECVDHRTKVNSTWTELVDGSLHEMASPAGIELFDGVLYVTDAGNGFLYAFDLEGNELDRAYTGIQDRGLQGVTARNAEELYLVDSKSNEILVLTLD